MCLTALPKYSWLLMRLRPSALPAVSPSCVVDVDQVDVAGHIELARAQLAHADHPELRAPGWRVAAGRRLVTDGHWRAVHCVELGKGQLAGHVERQLGQLGHGAGDRTPGRSPCSQSSTASRSSTSWRNTRSAAVWGRPLACNASSPCCMRVAHRQARGQQRQLGGVSAPHPLHEARMVCRRARGASRLLTKCCLGLRNLEHGWPS